MKIVRKAFKYLEPLWTDIATKRVSLKAVISIALVIDFIINVHNCASVVLKVLNLVLRDKTIDPLVVSGIATNLAQIAIIVGMEAGLIVALLGLKAYQNQTAVANAVADIKLNEETNP